MGWRDLPSCGSWVRAQNRQGPWWEAQCPDHCVSGAPLLTHLEDGQAGESSKG